MERQIRTWFSFVSLAFAAVGSSSYVLAEEPTIEKKPRPEQLTSFTTPLDTVGVDRSKHPLYPALLLAEKSLESIEKNVKDYTCNMVRRERIAGKVGNYEFLHAKIRHEQNEGAESVPFSVYLRFDKPTSIAGREALFVEGEHAGKVFVRRGGERMAYMSTYIKPDSRLAMKENRYPITEIGFKRMVERLVGIIENDIQYDECQVKFFKGAKVNGIPCTRIEVTHPIKRDHFTFHKATVFVDDKDKLPVAYSSYYWPEREGEEPRLLEEYIFTNIQLNVGLTDADFDRDNPEYGFNRKAEDVASTN
ncbi:DUF1571 domain-containing protein [Aeoliella sp. SH292]|uniref:DUF1571 domain-containing protein n=1 Tax=Aeoliella sp. SH292 TaxID=3454464 RepID=UPI003F995B90